MQAYCTRMYIYKLSDNVIKITNISYLLINYIYNSQSIRPAYNIMYI